MPEYGTTVSSRAGVRGLRKDPGTVSEKVSGPYENWVGESSPEARSKERLGQYGPKHLTNTELVAILLWSGLEGEDVFFLASRLLSRLGGLAAPPSPTYAMRSPPVRECGKPRPISYWPRWSWDGGSQPWRPPAR